MNIIETVNQAGQNTGNKSGTIVMFCDNWSLSLPPALPVRYYLTLIKKASRRMNKIQQADPKARTRALIITFAIIVIGMCAMALFESNQARLADWFVANMATIADKSGVVAAVVSAFFAPFYVVAGYLFLIGQRVIDNRRYPPPGQSVIRDTQIREGHAAVTRGRLLQSLSIALAVAVTVAIVFFVYLVDEITKAA